MRQRLGVARALVNDPQVVFLDEPTLGLDPAGQRQLLDLVARVARERGATVVLSTHVLAEVEETCDAVVILHRGRVVAAGTVAEVVRRAAAPRRGYLRVPPDQRSRAAELCAGDGHPASAVPGDRRDELVLTLPSDLSPEAASAHVLRVLLDGDVPVLGFSLEGGRLSDAFLAVTEERT
jgi:ABC-2 type transport system ATP-binding protein